MRINPDVIEISGLSVMIIAILNNDEYSPVEKINQINFAIAKAACKVNNLDALEAERKKIWEKLPKKLKFIAAVMSAMSFARWKAFFKREAR